MIRCIIEKACKKIKGKDYTLDSAIPLSYLVGIAIQREIMLCRGFLSSFGMGKSGKYLFIGRHVSLKCKSKIFVGTNITFQERVCSHICRKFGAKLSMKLI